MNQFRETLYSFKHTFGTPIDIYSESSPILDPETGKNNIIRTKQHVRRAVVMTSDLSTTFQLMLQFNKLTKFSGGIDTDVRDILIDPRDLKRSPTLGDYIDFEGRRYDVA